MPSGSPETLCLEPDSSTFREEVFLVLHGLNLHPDRMAPLCGLLQRAGFGVVRVALAGHDPNDSIALGKVTAGQWLDDVSRAFDMARRRWPKATVSLFGYSLGAPLGLVWGIEHEIAWRRVVLLAPALKVRGLLVPLLRLSGVIRQGQIGLPSLAPRSYRARATTTLAAYRALHDLIERLQARAAKWPRCPQLVIFADKDELISAETVIEYRDRLPGDVTLYPLALSWKRRYPRHLAIDPRTVGEAEWARLSTDLSAWLSSGHLPAATTESARFAHAPAAEAALNGQAVSR